MLRIDLANDFQDDTSLTDVGLDSLSAHELITRLGYDLGISIPIVELFHVATTTGLSQYVLDQVAQKVLLDTVIASDETANAPDDETMEVLEL